MAMEGKTSWVDMLKTAQMRPAEWLEGYHGYNRDARSPSGHMLDSSGRPVPQIRAWKNVAPGGEQKSVMTSGKGKWNGGSGSVNGANPDMAYRGWYGALGNPSLQSALDAGREYAFEKGTPLEKVMAAGSYLPEATAGMVGANSAAVLLKRLGIVPMARGVSGAMRSVASKIPGGSAVASGFGKAFGALSKLKTPIGVSMGAKEGIGTYLKGGNSGEIAGSALNGYAFPSFFLGGKYALPAFVAGIGLSEGGKSARSEGLENGIRKGVRSAVTEAAKFPLYMVAPLQTAAAEIGAQGNRVDRKRAELRYKIDRVLGKIMEGEEIRPKEYEGMELLKRMKGVLNDEDKVIWDTYAKNRMYDEILGKPWSREMASEMVKSIHKDFPKADGIRKEKMKALDDYLSRLEIGG